jgi:hypothetical protein
VAVAHWRVSGAAVVFGFVAGRCGAPLPEAGQILPSGDGPRPAPHGCVAGHLGGCESEVVQRMLGHASAAMTLDVYANLFESDLDEVAVTVAKMWPREPETNARSAPKTL